MTDKMTEGVVALGLGFVFILFLIFSPKVKYRIRKTNDGLFYIQDKMFFWSNLTEMRGGGIGTPAFKSIEEAEEYLRTRYRVSRARDEVVKELT